MEWTEENVLKLIGLYESFPVLWDPQHKFYKLNNKKNDAWMEISTALKISVADIKKKMNSILASFRRERQKVTHTVSGMGTNELYNGNWFAIRHLSFLSLKYQAKPTTSTLESEEITESPTQESQDYINLDETRIHAPDAGTSTTQVEKKAIDAPGTSNTQVEKKTAAPNQSKKRKMPDPLLSEAVNTLRDVKQRVTTAKESKDTFDKYGEYVAGELRQLDIYSASYIQNKLGEFFFHAKLGYFKPQTRFPNVVSGYDPNMFSPSPSASDCDSNMLSPGASSSSTNFKPQSRFPNVVSGHDPNMFSPLSASYYDPNMSSPGASSSSTNITHLPSAHPPQTQSTNENTPDEPALDFHVFH